MTLPVMPISDIVWPMSDHEFYMNRAIELAQKASGDTYPNPLVGCVVVQDNQVVAEGFHKKAGSNHAERDALTSVDKDFSKPGTILYVNLEPCSHQGRTPPCTEIIIEKKIPKVVFGMYDPNPQVAGSGITKLRKAGIEIEGPILEKRCKLLNRAFERNILKQETYFSLKSGSTVDGMMAMANGMSKWITGHDARQKVQDLRKICDGILVGVGTIKADNPSLTVRVDNEEVPNRVIIIDKNMDCPPEAKVFKKNFEVVIITASDDLDKKQNLQNSGATVVQVPLTKKYFGKELAKTLFELNFHHVLVEGGSHVNASFMAAGLVDEWHLFIAPKVLGGNNLSLFSNWSTESLDSPPEFTIVENEKLGEDLYLRMLPKP